MTAAVFNQSVWFRDVCCISRALQSNCQEYYHLWDICIFTQQHFEANKQWEIKFGWITLLSEYNKNQLNTVEETTASPALLKIYKPELRQ